MTDYWADNAAKLQAEMNARGVTADAPDDVIEASAGKWFAGLSENTRASVIATMRSMATH